MPTAISSTEHFAVLLDIVSLRFGRIDDGVMRYS
jgi:hypothetical protein